MKTTLLNFAKLAGAILILAVAINMFLGPHHIAAGGVSGLGILMEYLLNIDRAIVVLVLNVVMLALALVFLSREVFFNVLVGSLLFPVGLAIVPEVTLTEDRMLSVIAGSVLFGIGVAIMYGIKASSGGTTIPPLIFEKYFNLNTSIGLLLTDAFIVCFSLYVFGFEEFLFAVFSIVITSIVMIYIETGTNRKKAVMITSDQESAQLHAELQKIMTSKYSIFDVTSGNKEVDQKMILLVINDKDYPKVKTIVQKVDDDALVIAYNVSDVSGLGFTYHPIH